MSTKQRPVIVHLVHTLEGGGTERMLIKLLERFDPLRFEHKVITPRHAGALAARLPDHVACRALGAIGRSWTAGVWAAGAARRWRADLFHARNTCCWTDGLVAHLLTAGTRLALGFHGLDSGGAFDPRQRRTARWAHMIGSHFTSVSVSGAQRLREECGIPADSIAVLPNGIKADDWGPIDEAVRIETRGQLWRDEQVFVVGIVGSLTAVKNHELAVHAVASVAHSLPNVRLLIVGDGPLRRTIQRQVTDLGVGHLVRFTGWCDDVAGLMASMDAYVCSSVSEAMNNALLEAMAVGLPCVATDVGDNARMVRDGTEGLIVEPGDGVAMAQALTRLGRDPGLCGRMARAGRARALDYDLDEAAREYEKYYDALITKSRRGRQRLFISTSRVANRSVTARSVG